MSEIQQLSSQIVYQNKWMRLREDKVEFPNGQRGIYSVVEKPHFSLIIPVNRATRQVILVQQYRYPVQEILWEFPQGAVEGNSSLTPEEIALQELAEETGLIAKKMLHIGFLYEAYGFSNQGFHVFLAEDLHKVEPKPESTEHFLEQRPFSIDEFEELVSQGQIKDAPTVSAYGLLKIHKFI